MSEPSSEAGAGPAPGLRSVVGSWRLLSVVLLSFSSGLPLGLVWYRDPGLDARERRRHQGGRALHARAGAVVLQVALVAVMDRYPPPFSDAGAAGSLVAPGRALFALTLALAGVGPPAGPVWVVGALALAIAFASATQDIAIDAYAVEVLRRDEQGVAVGARMALYRAAMLVAGGVSITLAAGSSLARSST